MSDSMLTTIDNPYDPFTQFEEWYAYDTSMGYNSCGYLARIAATSPDLTDYENEKEIDRAIDEIIELNIYGIYKRVTNESKDST